MPDQQPSIVFGFPEFWPTVLEAYPEFFARKGKLEASLNSVNGREYESLSGHNQLLLHMLMLVSYGFSEVLVLVGNGMGLGAMKIVRGLVEQAINTTYLQNNPDEINRYVEWHHVERYRLLNRVDSVRNEWLNPELITEIEAEYERVKPLFKHADAKPGRPAKVKDTWSKENLFKRAEATGFVEIYMTVMPEANEILHGSMAGLRRHMKVEGDDGQVEFNPSLKYTRRALITAHEATLRTLEAVAQKLGVVTDPDIKMLEDDYIAIWNPKPQQEVL